MLVAKHKLRQGVAMGSCGRGGLGRLAMSEALEWPQVHSSRCASRKHKEALLGQHLWEGKKIKSFYNSTQYGAL